MLNEAKLNRIVLSPQSGAAGLSALGTNPSGHGKSPTSTEQSLWTFNSIVSPIETDRQVVVMKDGEGWRAWSFLGEPGLTLIEAPSG